MKTLAGRTIVVTRPAEQNEKLVGELERRGARVLAAPAIRIAPVRSAALSRALRELAAGDYRWLTLTSRSTVEMLASRSTSSRDVAARVAAIGEGTAAAWRRWSHHDPDLQPATYTTGALARAFPRGTGRVLCLRADIAPEGLEAQLAKKGWTPERVDAYRTTFPRSLPDDVRAALRAGEIDAVTFTSASTVRGFVRALGDGARGNPKVVCIGPVTARAARAAGFTVHAVASPHTEDGLTTALERALRPRGRPR